MRKLIVLSIISLVGFACKKNKKEELESEVIWLRAGFHAISKIDECPGSWIIERDSTKERYSCNWLPTPITAGKDFFAHCRTILKSNEVSECLESYSSLKQIAVVYIWYN